jgi:hypothetical protein
MQRSQNLNLANASVSVDGEKMDCPWCGETVIPKSAKREEGQRARGAMRVKAMQHQFMVPEREIRSNLVTQLCLG